MQTPRQSEKPVAGEEKPRFVRLYPGPTLMWGGEVKTPGGISFSARYCSANLYGLTDDGRVFALTFDRLAPDTAGYTWMRIGAPAERAPMKAVMHDGTCKKGQPRCAPEPGGGHHFVLLSESGDPQWVNLSGPAISPGDALDRARISGFGGFSVYPCPTCYGPGLR